MKSFLFAPALAAMICCSGIARAQWTTYQGSERHTGYAPGPFDASRFTQKYRVTVAEPRWLKQATIADGRAFITKDQWFDEVPQFFALDANTGATLWSKQF